MRLKNDENKVAVIIAIFAISVLLFSISVRLYGEENRIEICASVLGAISDPNSHEMSCINQDGSFNVEKYDYYMLTFSRCGATMTRELPFLVHEDRKTVFPAFMPYVFRDGKYDLSVFNDRYFDNLAAAAKTANSRGLRFVLSLFDDGGHGNFETSPWKLNHNGVDGWYSLRAEKYRYAWIDRVFETLRPYVFAFEICNELQDHGDPGYTVTVMSTVAAFLHTGKGVPLQYIFPGVRYMSPGRIPEGNSLFRKVKDGLKKWKVWNKRIVAGKVVHHIDEEFFRNYWHMQRHWSRCWISDDGCKPKRNRVWWENVMSAVFGGVKKLKNNKWFKTNTVMESVCRQKIELYNGYYVPALESREPDDIFASYGIAKAVENIYGVKLYKKTPVEQMDILIEKINERQALSGIFDNINFKEIFQNVLDQVMEGNNADGFKIKKMKWYEYIWLFLKAFFEGVLNK